MIKLGKLLVTWNHSNPADTLVLIDENGNRWYTTPAKHEFFGTLCFARIPGGTKDEKLDDLANVIGVARLHKYSDSDVRHMSFSDKPVRTYLGYDIFNKETGRKVSLRNALEQLTETGRLTVEERADVWEDYFDRFPDMFADIDPELKGKLEALKSAAIEEAIKIMDNEIKTL